MIVYGGESKTQEMCRFLQKRSEKQNPYIPLYASCYSDKR